PVGDASSGKLPRSDRSPLAFTKAMRPDQLTRLRIECDYGSPRASGRVQNAFDHEGGAFQLVLREGTEIVGLESPGNLELVEVRGVDLIQWRVPCPFQISAVNGPLAVCRAR